MLSLVENISSVLKPLKTRAVDTHQEEEKHHDSDNYKDNKKSHDTLNIDDKEFNTMSVKALLLFLEDFLETRLSPNKNKTTISPWIKQQPSNDMAMIQQKNATNAYAHAAETKYVPKEIVKQNEQYELKNIYALIKDLRHLQDCNVKYLKIESKEALIKGIFTASDNIKLEKNL